MNLLANATTSLHWTSIDNHVKTSFYRIYRKIDRLVVFVSKVTANIWVGDFH